MPSFFTQAQKDQIQEVFDDIHDSWKRDIIIYVEEKEDIPVDSNYNPIFGGSSNEPRISTRNVLVKHTKQARVFYADKGVERDSSSNLNIQISEGQLRLKVDSSTLELIKQSSKIEVDDSLWTLDGDPHAQGPFSTNYFIVYLKRIN